MIASHAGAVAGAWLYYAAIEMNWPAEEKYDSVGTNSQDMENNYQQVRLVCRENVSMILKQFVLVQQWLPRELFRRVPRKQALL